MRAFLFDDVDDRINKTYIYQNRDISFENMLAAFGLDSTLKGYYKTFRGLENVVGYKLKDDINQVVRELGTSIISVVVEGISTDRDGVASDEKIKLPDAVKDCAKAIVDYIYETDRFMRLKDRLTVLDQCIKIDTSHTDGLLPEGNWLRYMFIKESSGMYNPDQSEGKPRVFDSEYIFNIGEENYKCKLTTEWVGIRITADSQGNNYLGALIALVNRYYSDKFEIFEESGAYYLIIKSNDFSLDGLPDEFDASYSARFITALLAKPFVILTGNSGMNTGCSLNCSGLLNPLKDASLLKQMKLLFL